MALRSCMRNLSPLVHARRAPSHGAWKSQRCAFSSSRIHKGPFQLAVIGSGPAGFYATHKVMQRMPEARVDLFEQLPVPFGLVRFGVAPDHPEVKNCEARFAEVASSPRFGFFGNVQVGHSLQLSDLCENYDAVLFAYGASKDRELGVPGEHLRGVYSARAFVGWYNGLPEFDALEPDLESSDTAVIIGQGNVSLDVARLLLCSIDHLKTTDISEVALETLQKSRVKRVQIIGRRGTMQAAFTIKEARELLQLPSVRFDPIDASLLPSKDADLPRAQIRIAQLLTKHSTAAQDSAAPKRFSLEFLLSPQEFHADSRTHQLSSIDFRRNAFVDKSECLKKTANVVATEDVVNINAGLAFRSIGYKAEPLLGMLQLGIKFDDRAGRIPNIDGRVLLNGEPTKGIYCAGWVKSGPTGVIATTMEDSFVTAELIAQDFEGYRSTKPGADGIRGSLTDPVDWYNWQRIDLAERARGQKAGKEREKFRSVREMLEAA